MNISNAGVEVAAKEAAPIDASVHRAVPSSIHPGVKTDIIQPLKSTDSQNTTKKSTLSAEEAEQVTADLNEYLNGFQTNLSFSISEKLNQVIVEIKNKETNELIKQIPSEEILELREKMEELAGLLFDGAV